LARPTLVDPNAGINFFDNAWEYHDGRSEEVVREALAGKRDRAIVMTKVCTHGRKKDVAMEQLEQSLRRLKTDHIEVWQIHESDLLERSGFDLCAERSCGSSG
jgi:uncharacterized protein